MRSASLLAVTLALLVLPAPRASAQEKPEQKDGVAAVSTKAKPLPEPPAALAKLLAVYDKDPEPMRECKRLYASSLYYLLERDLERFVACFHKDFEVHQGMELQKIPPEELRGRIRKLWSEVPKTPLKLDELVQLDKARAYTKEQAAKWVGDWKKEPSEIAKIMQDGDWLVIAPTNKRALGDKATDFDAEVFYVLRQQDGIWKIAIGE